MKRSGRLAEQRHQLRQRLDVLAVDLDQLQRRRAFGSSAATAACTALTSELLPMPRAPQSSALLAGRPAAKRRVFSSSVSRERSMPFRSGSATRLTFGTGCRRGGSACQTKASAAERSGTAGAGGRQPLERRGDALEAASRGRDQSSLQACALRELGAAARYHARAGQGKAPRRPRCRLRLHRPAPWLYSAQLFTGRGPLRRNGTLHVGHPGLCAEPGGGGTDIVSMLLPFVLIFIIMYFLILRPQRQQAKRREEMLKAIRRGDTVITNGGIVGKVTKVVDDSEVELQIAEGVKVRAMRSLIAEVRAKAEPVAGNTPLKRRRPCFISRAGRSRSSCWSSLAGFIADAFRTSSPPRRSRRGRRSCRKRQMVLGLDLRGGAHLLLEVDRESLVADRVRRSKATSGRRCATQRIGYRNLAARGQAVSFTLREPADAQRALTGAAAARRADPVRPVRPGHDQRGRAIEERTGASPPR